MNTVMLRSLILFVVVTFGDSQMVTPETGRKMDECLDIITYKYHAECLQDESRRVTCLKEIVPANDFDKMEIEEAINYEEEKQNGCPALTAENKCVNTEIAMCMSEVFTSRIFHNSAVCFQLQRARDCLVTLNNTCDSDVTIPEIMTLDTVRDECDSGYWNDGPCSPQKVMLCTTGILYNVYYHGQDIFSYDCGKLDTVKTCLNDLKANCNVKKLQDKIDSTMEQVDKKCPTVNSK